MTQSREESETKKDELTKGREEKPKEHYEKVEPMVPFRFQVDLLGKGMVIVGHTGPMLYCRVFVSKDLEDLMVKSTVNPNQKLEFWFKAERCLAWPFQRKVGSTPLDGTWRFGVNRDFAAVREGLGVGFATCDTTGDGSFKLAKGAN